MGSIEATPSMLQALSDRSMPGRERAHIGEWICRAASGVTGRSNSCTPVGDPGVAAAQAVDFVEAWFVERGLRPLFQMWDGGSAALVEELDRRGYVSGEGADVFVRELESLRWPRPTHPIRVSSRLDDLQSAGANAQRLSELGSSSLEKIAVTADLEALGSWPSGGVGIVDGPTVGIFSMATVPEHRGRGLGRTVLSTLLNEALERDTNLAWLQVTPSNEPARRLYTTFGFTPVHSYHYRAAPTDA